MTDKKLVNIPASFCNYLLNILRTLVFSLRQFPVSTIVVDRGHQELGNIIQAGKKLRYLKNVWEGSFVLKPGVCCRQNVKRDFLRQLWDKFSNTGALG